MLIKKYIGKDLDIERLCDDISKRNLSGVNFFKKGMADEEFEVVEVLINRNTDFIYAIKIFLADNKIKEISRVKFQAMCGGWRSKDRPLKRFPIHMLGEKWVEEFIKDYQVGR